MSGPLPVMPLDTLRAKVGELIEEAKTRNLPMSTLTLLSIGEYLKDAERWQHVAENTIQWNNFEPRTAVDFRNWIDQEISNERERVIRARQRREDGVPGSSGAGDAADPVI